MAHCVSRSQTRCATSRCCHPCFVRGIRGLWRKQAYRGAVEAAKRTGSDDPAEIEHQARNSTAYSLYSWLEHLSLDPTFELPGYVRAVDSHLHAGGVWSDPEDAFACETSANPYSFSLFDPQRPMQLYAETAKALAPGAKAILDLGCTAGHSRRALA